MGGTFSTSRKKSQVDVGYVEAARRVNRTSRPRRIRHSNEKKVSKLIGWCSTSLPRQDNIHSLANVAEPVSSSRQLCSYSRTSQDFMKPEGLTPCSQKPSTGPILSHINPVHTASSYLSRIHFNIVYPPTYWSS
jgi:hypothetical protein